MYLLQAPGFETYIIYLLSVIVSLCIFYLIIKSAVKAGTEKVHNQFFIQNRLLIEQMKKDGTTDERIKELVSKEIPKE